MIICKLCHFFKKSRLICIYSKITDAQVTDDHTDDITDDITDYHTDDHTDDHTADNILMIQIIVIHILKLSTKFVLT